MTSQSSCTDWKAWHDNQPPGPATLHVIGKCAFPDSGYTVELKPHEPQGINPGIYLLDKIVNVPTHVSHHPSTLDVKYSEKTTVKYSEVHILPDDVHVPVKEVW
jgi:hypothetical protein